MNAKFMILKNLAYRNTYWHFSNYVALYQVQEFEDCKNLRINMTKYIKKVTHCFILNGRELPIHYSTIADLFCEIFRDVYLQSFKVFKVLQGLCSYRNANNYSNTNILQSCQEELGKKKTNLNSEMSR